jgi:predicted enzyme related to lactoylglutathione lyase
MSPILHPAPQERHPGKMIFAELVTPDLASAKQFYGGLFGWTFQDSRMGAHRDYGETYCGSQIEESMHKVLDGENHGSPRPST